MLTDLSLAEQDYATFLEAVFWGSSGPVCPHCDGRLTTSWRNSKVLPTGAHNCRMCSRRFQAWMQGPLSHQGLTPSRFAQLVRDAPRELSAYRTSRLLGMNYESTRKLKAQLEEAEQIPDLARKLAFIREVSDTRLVAIARGEAKTQRRGGGNVVPIPAENLLFDDETTERFVSLIDQQDEAAGGHFLWRGPVNPQGKTNVFDALVRQPTGKNVRRRVTAMRYSYQYFVRPLSADERPYRSCSEILCVNPEHAIVLAHGKCNHGHPDPDPDKLCPQCVQSTDAATRRFSPPRGAFNGRRRTNWVEEAKSYWTQK